MYLEAFGQPIIVINDALMAKELLEKRSALYSSRCVLWRIAGLNGSVIALNASLADLLLGCSQKCAYQS